MSSRQRHPNPYLIVACAVGCLWLTPRHAQAQWYVVGFSGANTTGKATVLVDQPSRDTPDNRARPSNRDRHVDSTFAIRAQKDRTTESNDERIHLLQFPAPTGRCADASNVRGAS